MNEKSCDVYDKDAISCSSGVIEKCVLGMMLNTDKSACISCPSGNMCNGTINSSCGGEECIDGKITKCLLGKKIAIDWQSC